MKKFGLREWGMLILVVICVVIISMQSLKAQSCVYSVTDVAHGLTAETRFDINNRKAVLEDIEEIMYQDGQKILHLLYHPIGIYPVKEVNGIWFVTLSTRELQHKISVQFSEGKLQFPKGYSMEDYFHKFTVPVINIKND